jgi:rhomboid protease GluP
MKLRYNAPTTLTFTLLCTIVLILNLYLLPGLTQTFFAVPGHGGSIGGNQVRGFNTKDGLDYMRLFTHIIGHAGWDHLISNFMIILLIGPILEQSYGSLSILLMMIITALATGVFNALLFPGYLMGASGVAFMMILLVSFANSKRGEVPITFILIVALYLGNEVLASFKPDNISHFAHIVGGACGSLFGFFKPPKRA